MCLCLSTKIEEERPESGTETRNHMNVCTMTGKAGELVELMQRRKVNIPCIQEER